MGIDVGPAIEHFHYLQKPVVFAAADFQALDFQTLSQNKSSLAVPDSLKVLSLRVFAPRHYPGHRT